MYNLIVNTMNVSAYKKFILQEVDSSNGGITTTIKHAIKLTIKLGTSPGAARLAQLLQPSLAFCCKL